MNRELRKLVASIVTVVTFLALFFATNPLVTRWGTAKIQEVAKAGGSGVASKLMWQGVIPQVAVVLICFALSVVVGLIVAKKLPADPPAKRSRRR